MPSLPNSLFTVETEVVEVTDTTIPEPLQPDLSTDLQAYEGMLEDGRVPSGSTIRTRRVVACHFVPLFPGAEPIEVVYNDGCVLYRLEWICKEYLDDYWVVSAAQEIPVRRRPGPELPEEVRFVLVCPDGRHSVRTSTGLPPVPEEKGYIVLHSYQEHEVEVLVEEFWKLVPPLRVVGCRVYATYRWTRRTTRTRDGKPVEEPLEEVDPNANTRTDWLEIPGCHDDRMHLHTTNTAGERSLYRITTFADHLKSAGLAAQEAREVATAVRELACDTGALEIPTSVLRRIAHEVASAGLARVSLADLLHPSGEVEKLPLPAAPPGAALPRTPPSERLAPQRDRPSIFRVLVLPLLEQARALRATNRPLADLVWELAHLCQGVAEVTLSRHVNSLLAMLDEAGLRMEAIRGLRSALLSGSLPFDAPYLARRLGKRLSAALQAEILNPEDPMRSLQLRLTEVGDRVFGSTRGGGTRAPERSAAYTMVASCDRPRVVSGSTYSGVNIEPATAPFDGDDIRATEITILGDVMNGLSKDDVVRGESLTSVYRANIAEDLPNGWFENIRPGITIKVFSLVLTEENTFPFADQLQNLLSQNEQRIKEKIDEIARRAGNTAAELASANGAGGLSSGVKSIVAQVVKGGLNRLYELIVNVLGGEEFHVAMLVHAVNWPAPLPPESIFTLQVSGSEPCLLYRVERDAKLPLSSSRLVEQGGLPYYPPGGPPVDFLRTSRRMYGASHDPAQPAPADLWRKIGARKGAAVWASTEDREGFHALVSIRQVGGDGLYVWGLRADLRRTGDGSVIV